MGDLTYDAVVIGGGAKGFVTALYLAKYGGMSVGIFERRHELGGGLASDESSAPGFIGDSHATNTALIYYSPIEEDFPDFVEKGGRMVHQKATAGVITREDQKCCVIYSVLEDPTQEKTAANIARFAGQKDADTYLKMWHYAFKSEYDRVTKEWMNNIPKPGEPMAEEKWFMDWCKEPDCPFDPELRVLSPVKAAQQLFENFGLSLLFIRRAQASGSQPVEPYGGLELVRWVLAQPTLTTIWGGTHSVAHAYVRMFLEHGGKFHTHSEVEKIIIENGAAKGIVLADGTQVRANKVVVSNAGPKQLCFQLVGGEHFSERVIKKVKQLEAGAGAISWTTWAHIEPVNFKAAEFNPDINLCQNVTLGTLDPEIWNREYYMRKLGQIPPIEGLVHHHIYDRGADKSRVLGKKGYTSLTETPLPPATALTEREWMAYKKKYADDVVREWGVYTTNMTWDNISGYSAILPYDTAARLIAARPSGDWGVCDVENWRPLSMRPISEFSNHRIANIKNLYGTAGCWGHPGAAADTGYRAYKAIAEDLGLRKPWEEKGRTW